MSIENQLRDLLGYPVGHFPPNTLGKIGKAVASLIKGGVNTIQALRAAISQCAPSLGLPGAVGSFAGDSRPDPACNVYPKGSIQPRPPDALAPSTTEAINAVAHLLANALRHHQHLTDGQVKAIGIVWSLTAEEIAEAGRRAQKIISEESEGNQIALARQTEQAAAFAAYVDALTAKAELSKDPADLAKAREVLEQVRKFYGNQF